MDKKIQKCEKILYKHKIMLEELQIIMTLIILQS